MFLKYIFYSLLFLISFTCANGLLNDNSYIKQFAFGTIFLFMGIISIMQKEPRECVIKVLWGDILMLLLFALYLYFYIGTQNDLDYTLPILYFVFYCFMRIYTQGNSKEIIVLLTKIVPIVIFMHITVCCLQFINIIPNFHDFFHVGSTFGNPDKLGAYLAVLLPFCYINQKRKIVGYSALIVCVFLLFLLQARTALLAIAVPGIVYLVSRNILLKKHLLWGLIPGVFGLIALIYWHPVSVSGRFFIWIVASSMIVSKPQGWGLYAFQKHYPEFQSNFILNHPKIAETFNIDVVHSSFNEFLNIGVTLGVLGLLCYVLLIIYILISAYKAHSPLLFPLISFQIVSFSYFPFQIVPLTVVFVLLMAMAINSDSTHTIKIVGIRYRALVIISLIVFSSFLSFSNMQNYQQWQLAVKYAQDKKTHTVSDEIFKKQYPQMLGNGLFLLSYAELSDKMGDTPLSFSLLKEADNYYSDPVFLQILSSAYEKQGDINEAKRKFEIAVNMLPEQFNIAYEQILFLQRIGEKKKVYELALKLHNKPIKSTYYVDSQIIKKRLEAIILSYEKTN